MQESSGSVGSGSFETQEGCGCCKENYSNQVEGKGVYNDVDEYDNSKVWTEMKFGQKGNWCSSELKPRLRAESVVLSEEFCIWVGLSWFLSPV